jgi:hypothetical protein
LWSIPTPRTPPKARRAKSWRAPNEVRGDASPRALARTFGEADGIELRCSFCSKPSDAVRNLISSPGTEASRALICDECVDLCVEIIAEEQAEIEAEREE